MSKGRLLLIVGVWVAILPYLGIPHFWKSVLFSISGLGIAVWGYFLYKENEEKKGVPDNFTETGSN